MPQIESGRWQSQLLLTKQMREEKLLQRRAKVSSEHDNVQSIADCLVMTQADMKHKRRQLEDGLQQVSGGAACRQCCCQGGGQRGLACAACSAPCWPQATWLATGHMAGGT